MTLKLQLHCHGDLIQLFSCHYVGSRRLGDWMALSSGFYWLAILGGSLLAKKKKKRKSNKV
jgi:hypothetical protein